MSANTLKFVLLGLFALIGLIFSGIFAFIATVKAREDAKKRKEAKKEDAIRRFMNQLSKGA